MNNTYEEYKGISEERQMSLRVKGLQELHKKYNLCVIELSQLSREASKEGRRPKMSDLKDSGAIEANAVQVWLLYRPDYYEKEPKDTDGTDLRGLCEINVAKNRYGETKAVYARFMGKYSAFENYTKGETNTEDAF
jgi:replicative DNA helicase